MLALSIFLVSPELLMRLIPSMFPELSLLIVCTLVSLDHLVNGIIKVFLCLLWFHGLHRIVAVERQAHKDTVEPNLVGIDSFVPINTFLGTRLLLQLLEECLQCLVGTLRREEVVHTEDEFRRAHIVEIEILVLVLSDIALFVNHLGRVFLQVVEDSLIVGFSILSLESALVVLII